MSEAPNPFAWPPLPEPDKQRYAGSSYRCTISTVEFLNLARARARAALRKGDPTGLTKLEVAMYEAYRAGKPSRVKFKS